MRPIAKIFSTLFAAAAVPVVAQAATVGGYYYAVQYDYREFYAATDGKPFQVLLEGNPFPSMPATEVAAQLLPQMQANKPRARLTFTYDAPAGEQHPYYRLYLISNPANDLLADNVCATGRIRHREGTPGRFYVQAIYCRNELALTHTTAWTAAAGPADPAVGQLCKELFAVVFTDSPALYPKSSIKMTP